MRIKQKHYFGFTLLALLLAACGALTAVPPASPTPGRATPSLARFEIDGVKIQMAENGFLTQTVPAPTPAPPAPLLLPTLSPLMRVGRSEPSWLKTEPEPDTHSPDRLIALSKATGDQKRSQKLAALRDKLVDNILTWSPDGNLLLSDHPVDGQSPVIWDAQTGEALVSLDFADIDPYLVNTLQWSPDGKLVVCASLNNNIDDGFAALWDAQTGKQISLLTGMKTTTKPVNLISWSPDGRWLAVVEYISGKIFLWDLRTYSPVAVLDSCAGMLLDVNWSPDGAMLACSGLDGTALVWRMP